MMFKRYIENSRNNQEEYQKYFTKREYNNDIYKLVFVILTAFLAVAFAAYFLTDPKKFIILTSIISVVFIAISLWFYTLMNSSNDIIMETELQNLIFSSAATNSSWFFIIVRNDSSIVYFDKDFSDLFIADSKEKKITELDYLLDSNLISKDQRSLILDALNSNQELVTKVNHPEFGMSVIDIQPINVMFRKSEQNTGYKYAIIKGVKKTISNEHDNILSIEDNIPLFSVDKDNKLHNCNEAFASMLCYSDYRQLIGLDITKIVGPHDDSDYRRDFYRYQKSTISAYQFNISNVDHIKTYIACIPSNHDLEKNAEDYIDYFVDNSPIAKLILDKDGLVEKENIAFDKIIALDKKNKWPFLDIVHADYKEKILQIIKDIIDNPSYKEKGNYSNFEAKLIDVNNKEVTVLLYIHLLSSIGDAPAKIAFHIIDMSAQKTLEMNFVHSQKMQAVGQLAGGIAHDFNNLLTAMMGFCDLLLMRHPPGDQSFADIMQIKQNTNRAASLVRQLLAFSRKQVLQPKVIEVTNILDESSNLIRRLIGENIELRINHGRDLWLVKVDQNQLEQVIVNLAVNARDAMEKNGVLTINTSNVSIASAESMDPKLISPIEDNKIDPGKYVLIEISDTGSGISEELISKIFEPFFTTKELGEGTGLGLSTVYGIVKQTGGYLYLTTKINEGTKFSIFLRKHEDNGNAELSLEKTSDDHSAMLSSDLTGTGNILLVEDETPIRMFASHALLNKGYKIFEAEEAHSALQVIEEHGDEIDLIISDVMMAGMGGPEMVQEIRKKYPDIKVIFISGYAEDAFVDEYGTDNNFNFLAKPFTLKQLALKVKEVME